MGLKKLDPTLRWLAIQMAAATIGCSWCIDYAYYEGMNEGIDPAKVRAVGQWRDSELFDERERAVLEYAEKASGSPAEVSDELGRPAPERCSATPRSSSWPPGSRSRTCGRASTPDWACTARDSRSPVRSLWRRRQGRSPDRAAVA